MAVDKQRVIARLKALFPKANLSQKRLDAYADKLAPKPEDDADDAAIDALINDYNDVIDFVAVAAEDDRVRTLEKKANEQKPNSVPTNPNPANPTNQEPPANPAPAEEVPVWAKTLLEKVEKLETGKVLETKKQTAQSLFENSEVFKNASKEVKDFMFKNIDLNSDTSFEDQIKGLEETFSQMVQKTADETSYPGPAGSGRSTTGVDEKEVERLVNEM